ncbi:MAG TPA: sigma-70 family RNA polymerase sigma factor [Thermoanaerobaculia bacterium]|nr:sigma-70 family RNA polymerase sigma factor [Thermoanaerobaculia bacterium]
MPTMMPMMMPTTTQQTTPPSGRPPTPVGRGPVPAPEGEAERAAAIRRRDPDALRDVVETYLPQILRAARGAGLTAQDAEDVAQETFTTFLDVAHRFEGRSHVRTFVFGILYRKLSEARRGFARLRAHDPIDDVLESRFAADGTWVRPPETADALAEGTELRRSLASCLKASPPAQRLAFHLREVEGLARQEICKILEITSTNLDVMLFRLRNRTRECLEAKQIMRTGRRR